MITLAAAETRTEPRLLEGLHPRRAPTLEEHLRLYGPLAAGRDLIGEIEAAGLTGRGGAAFPTAVKLRAVSARRGRPVVVVNGLEGEPSSAKDRLLLRRLPHLVIDGAVRLASALGTRDVLIAHAAAAWREGEALRAALDERARGGLHDRAEIEVVAVPDGFLSGQETALVRYLNGGPALPTFTPPRPFESGVARRPTLVQNAETAAQIALIAHRGAAWFRQAGTAAEPGTALFTVSGGVARPGVYEAALGSPLRALVAAAGGLTATPRALLVGGYSGTWIEAGQAAGLTLDEAALRAVGGSLGVGAIAVLPADACGLCESARVARYLARESAGQCGPCFNGLDAIAGRLERQGADRTALDRWGAMVSGRGACRHPDGAARFVSSAVRVFGLELDRHDPRRCAGGRRRILPT
jgi:NADH:ubiquinone oxidoreductase subunit F (NADH-binding)